MSDAWNDMKRAKEEAFFERQNQEALARLKKRENEQKPRLSPITGQPMEQLTLMGVVVDRCQTSGGIWLDAGELEQLIKAAQEKETGEAWSKSFFSGLFSKKQN